MFERKSKAAEDLREEKKSYKDDRYEKQSQRRFWRKIKVTVHVREQKLSYRGCCGGKATLQCKFESKSKV